MTRVNFTVGVFIEKLGADQKWTALVPDAHAIVVQGGNETRLREMRGPGPILTPAE